MDPSSTVIRTKTGELQILLVQNNPVEAMALVKKLAQMGHKVAHASDGFVAMNAIDRYDPDVIITDWTMPRMDGLQLVRYVRQIKTSHYIYIIMMTSRGMSDDLVQAFDAGVDDFLRKPAQLAELPLRLLPAARMRGLEKTLREQIDLTSRAEAGKSAAPSAAMSAAEASVSASATDVIQAALARLMEIQGK